MIVNQQKITWEFCKDKVLIFFPASEEEAAFIQRNLLMLGAKWPNEPSCEVRELEKCVRRGLNLDNGILYAAAPQSDIEKGFLCNAGQFSADYIPSDRAFMMEMFNRMAEKIATLSEEVAALRKELQPQRLDKPILKKPDQQP